MLGSLRSIGGRSLAGMFARRSHRALPFLRTAFGVAGVGGVISLGIHGYTSCHGHGQAHGHAHSHVESHPDGAANVSGQGSAMFSWDKELSDALPEEMRPFEAAMHGGFTEDGETGCVYTGMPGYGLVRISADLKTWTKVGVDPRLVQNIHGLTLFQHDGKTFIAAALNDAQSVLILDLDGLVIQELKRPKGSEFSFPEANTFYKGYLGQPDAKSKDGPVLPAAFCCTDVAHLEGKLYVVTGYCDGDFVLTAQPDAAGIWHWGPVAWGGKGHGPGKFQTAHGIFSHDGNLYVANREAHQVNKFDKDGLFLTEFPGIPAGARICNVAHAEHEGYFVLNSLVPLGDQTSAPIYAYDEDSQRLLSTIVPGDLGIPVLSHLHHVWPHYVSGQAVEGEAVTSQLYLLLHGWNQGKFAVLKHQPMVQASQLATGDDTDSSAGAEADKDVEADSDGADEDRYDAEGSDSDEDDEDRDAVVSYPGKLFDRHAPWRSKLDL